jgi:putative ABC transport system permease protein
LKAEIHESLLMAMGALAAHKLRTALTLVGVAVGVFSIIVVVTAMRVMQSNIEQELSQLGTHTISIQRHPVIHVMGRENWEKIWRRKPLYYPQYQQLKDRLTLASAVGVETRFARDAAFSRLAETQAEIPLYGVSPEVFAARNWIVEAGRGLLGVDAGRNVCVLGNSLARKLFSSGSGVGEKVRYGGIHYTVVGVLESRGRSLGGDQDSFLAIPMQTGLNRYGAQYRSLTILVQAPNATTFDDTIEQARGALRAIRKVAPAEEDDFELFTNDSLVNQFRSITLAVRIGASVISSIALVAAGIGIMNIMLVSVTERTREIGIRRAIGARKRNILTQFILEAMVICQIGGVVGIILGILGGNLAAMALGVTPVIPVDWVVFGLLICSAVGVVFGTYPAIKAANLDPIEALRYE